MSMVLLVLPLNNRNHGDKRKNVFFRGSYCFSAELLYFNLISVYFSLSVTFKIIYYRFSQSSAISNYDDSICRFVIRFSLNTRVFIEVIYLHLCSVWIKNSNGDKEKKIPGKRKLFNSFILYRFMPIIFRLVIRYDCCHFHIYPLSYLSFFHVLFRLLTQSTNVWLEHKME